MRTRSRAAGESGSMLIMVMVIVTILTMFAVVNSVVLGHLRREIRLIEEKQVQKLQKPTAQERAQ